MTLIRLELLRVGRDRRFWFWSLVGVPILLPATVLVFAFAMASFGTVESQVVRPVVATTATNQELLSDLHATGIDTRNFDDRAELVSALTAGDFSVGLVDVSIEPGQPLSATLIAVGQARQLPIYESLKSALERISLARRTKLMDSLDFDGPSFDLLLQPIVIAEERAPDRLPSGLRQVVTLVWCALLLFPYLLLTWNGGSRAVTDRLSGYLAPLNSCSMSPWKWLVARWAALSVVGTALLFFSAALFALYMRAYSTFADWMVAEGALQSLSEQALLAARAYLVDAVAIWRNTSVLSFFLWLLVGAVQLSAASALVIWGSVKAATLAQYRLFELLPFTVVFLLPFLGMGALGSEIGSSSWVPGLNTVLSIEYLVAGDLPGFLFFASTAAAVLSNILTTVVFLLLGAWALRNEKLWAV